MTELSVRKRKKSVNRGDLIFYCLMMIWPVLQFSVFYIATKVNSILYSFQSFDVLTGSVTWTTSHLSTAFKMMTKSAEFRSMMQVTLQSFALTVGIGTPLGILFSYYISKKMAGSRLFRVVLFLPSIISAIVMVSMYQFFVEQALPELVFRMTGERVKGLIENPDTRFGTIMFYNIWVSFGVNVLMYSNSMSAIPADVIEAAKIDGASRWQTLWKVTIPNVMPSITICTFLSLTNGFKLFDQNLALTGGQPYTILSDGSSIKETEMLALNILNTFYGQNANSRGTAQAKAVLFFILVATIGLLQLSANRKKEVQQ